MLNYIMFGIERRMGRICISILVEEVIELLESLALYRHFYGGSWWTKKAGLLMDSLVVNVTSQRGH
jgi:hypothetical protein